MSSKRHQRRTKCERKKKFATARAARARAQEIYQRGGDFMNEYRCRHCSQYHLGHVPARIEKARAFGAASFFIVRKLNRRVEAQSQ